MDVGGGLVPKTNGSLDFDTEGGGLVAEGVALKGDEVGRHVFEREGCTK